MFKRLIFFCCFLFLHLHGSAQVLNYSIKLKDEVIGRMTAIRNGLTNSEFFIESNITLQKIVRLELNYSIKSEFKNNVLEHSVAKQFYNGKEHANTITVKGKADYAIATLKEEKTISAKSIPYNLCKLYYEEPANLHQVYSDTFGEMLEIKPAGEHRYELVLPDGKSNFYTYYHGICILVELEFMFGKVLFQLTR